MGGGIGEREPGEERYVGMRMVDRTFTVHYDSPIRLTVGGNHNLHIGKVEDLGVERDPNKEPFVIIDRERQRSMPLVNGCRILLSDGRSRERFDLTPAEQFRVGIKRTGDKITIVYLGETAPIVAVRQPH